jgi:hypothetical protein
MEQDVAATLQDFGFNATTGRAFEDPEEGKSREIDVWAYRRIVSDDERQIFIDLYLICECKNNSYPLVLLGKKKTPSDLKRPINGFEFPTRIKLYRAGGYREIDPFHTLGIAKSHYYFRDPNVAVQLVQLLRQSGKWKAQTGNLFDSLVYPLAKALDVSRREWRRSTEPYVVRLYVPVAVIRGPMYYVDTSSSSATAKACNRATLVREIRSKHLSGRFAIEFIRQNALADWLTDDMDPFVAAVTDLADSRPGLLKRTEMRRGDEGYDADLLN